VTELKLAISLDRQRIAEFCHRWKIVELSLFGSVLRDDFRPDSDVDVLVTFAPDARWSLFDAEAMEEELEQVFGRPVDLVTRRAVENSHNWIRKRAILEAAEPVYVAG
jgi:predicted nucleotidyltransferase